MSSLLGKRKRSPEIPRGVMNLIKENLYGSKWRTTFDVCLIEMMKQFQSLVYYDEHRFLPCDMIYPSKAISKHYLRRRNWMLLHYIIHFHNRDIVPTTEDKCLIKSSLEIRKYPIELDKGLQEIQQAFSVKLNFDAGVKKLPLYPDIDEYYRFQRCTLTWFDSMQSIEDKVRQLFA